MPATVGHNLSATTPDDPSFEIRPSHWNSAHDVTLNISASEISGLFSNANGVSFGLSNSSITASVQTNYAGVGETVGTVAGTDLGLTVNTDGVSIAYPKWLTTAQPVGAYLTTARASNDGVGLNTAQTNVTWTVNSNGLSFNAGGYAGTGLTTATTAGTAIVGTNNTAGLSLGVPAYLTTAQPPGAYLTTARASNDAIGLNTAQSNVTWTANSSGLSLDARGYAGTGTSATNATITLNSNGLAISVANPGAGGGIAAAAGTQTATSGTVNFANSNGVTFGMSGSTQITASIPLNATASEFEPVFGSSLLTNSTLGQNTLYFQGFDVPQDLSAYRINFFASINTLVSNSNNTRSGGLTMSAGLYSRGTGASTERIERFWSGSWAITFTGSSNSQLRVGHPGGIANSTSVSTLTTAISSSNASTYMLNSVGGYRMIPMPISSTLTPGRYWIALAQSSVSANTQGLVNMSVLQQTNGNNIAYRPFGTSSAASNASVFPTWPGDGTYSATSGAFPATVALSNSDIRAPVVFTLPYFNFSGYTTGTNLL